MNEPNPPTLLQRMAQLSQQAPGLSSAQLAELYTSLRIEKSRRKREFEEQYEAMSALQETVMAQTQSRFNAEGKQNETYTNGVRAYKKRIYQVQTRNSADLVAHILEDPEERVHLLQSRPSPDACKAHAKKQPTGTIPGVHIQPIDKIIYERVK